MEANKRYAKRRYYRRWWRRRRSITDQYLRAKIDFVDEIAWPNEQADGPSFKAAGIGTVSIETIIQKDEWTSYKKLFGYAKVYAVSIEMRPICAAVISNVAENGTLLVGFNPASDVGYDYARGSVSNLAVIGSAVQNQRMFRRLDNSIGYITTQGAMRGSFYVVANYQTTADRGQRWSVRCTLYVIFKVARV